MMAPLTNWTRNPPPMVPMLSSVMVRPSRCGATSERPCDITTEVMPVEKPIIANTMSSSGTGSVPNAGQQHQRGEAGRRRRS